MTELPIVGSTVEQVLEGLFDTVSAAASLVVTAATWIAFAAVSVGWLVFWSALARIHVLHGDPLPAALSMGAVVVPAVTLWYVRSSG